MKTIFNRFSAAFAALAVMAAVVFDLSAKTASAASCDIDHSNATQLTEEPEQLTGSSYYLGESIVLTKEIAIEGAVTLCLNGQTITAASGSRVFTIKNGGSLTICDCQNAGEITGGNVSSGNDENSDSYGGAIIIDNGGSLTLNGGKIAVCSAKRGGGVCVNGGTFTINAGTISQNTAEHQGGGVYVSGGTFTMNGGTILGNTVTGSGATDGGGGVYTAGTFTLNGGSKISDNKAESSFGGGVLVSGTNAEFTLQSGTSAGNRANQGGGVHVSS
ncbi:MAG: carbohydrate-binding domain-containing protein, partial [Oscillospiraceae bacterium]|nr:carbohydrate-binding domain-containing protein [Oscillospiraceae bacterium]